MDRRFTGKRIVALECAMLGVVLGVQGARAQTEIDFDLQISVQSDVQVLTRGPVHEAFAEPVSFEPQPGIVVARAPAEPIEEFAPEQRPDGVNVAWISGYWGWDDDRDDFLWVSGVWRVVPPGRQWISGYWRPAGGGFQWVPGYWADADADEIEFLPEPPDPIEELVPTSAPSAELVWLPGCWVWNHGSYAWRPGYWAPMRPDWVWIPPHYNWCPRGYVFVDGYWDHAIARRGVLFAPVYFEPAYVARRVNRYSPRVVINVDLVTDHLFVRPAHCHYYFGDFYAARYVDAGYYPSHAYHVKRIGYDPIYVQRRWSHRSEPDWENRLRVSFEYRRDHEDARPPRTLSASLELAKRRSEPEARNLVLATSLTRMSKSPSSAMRLRQVDPEERREMEERVKLTRKARDERNAIEAREIRPMPEKAAEQAPPGRAKLPRSPAKSRANASPQENQAPPRKQDVPPIDPTVRPKPKKAKIDKSKGKDKND